MTLTVGTLQGLLDLDNKPFDSTLDRSMRSGESRMSKWAKRTAGLIGGAFAVTKGIDLVGGLIGDAEDARKVTKQTNAVLASTGKVARISAAGVAKLAEKLSMKAGVDDELIQSGENVLLTFTKVRNEVGKGNNIFDQGVSIALDMSTALGTDLQGSVMQVGKALNDPVKGITALQRVGVSFTAKQKATIKRLAETGDVLGAQKLILQELNTEFAGSAEAQATAGGRLSVVWGNLREQLGSYLLPVVDKAASWLSDRLPGAMETTETWFNTRLVPAVKDTWHWFEDNLLPTLSTITTWFLENVPAAIGATVGKLIEIGQWIVDHQPILAGLATAVGVVLAGAFLAWAASAASAAVSTTLAMLPVYLIIAAVALLAAGLYYAYTNWDWFRDGVNGAKDAIVTIIGWVITVIRWIDDLVDALDRALDRLGRLGGGLTGSLGGSGGFGTGGKAGDYIKNGGGQPSSGGKTAGSAAANIVKQALEGHDLGGTVSGPRGKPRVILAHGGERVLPTHRMSTAAALRDQGIDAGGKGGDTYVTYEIHASTIAEREIGRVVRDALRRGDNAGLVAP